MNNNEADAPRYNVKAAYDHAKVGYETAREECFRTMRVYDHVAEICASAWDTGVLSQAEYARLVKCRGRALRAYLRAKDIERWARRILKRRGMYMGVCVEGG